MPNARVPVPVQPPASDAERRGAGVLRAADGRCYVGDADGRLWRVHLARWDPERRRHRTAEGSIATHLLFVRHDGTRRAAPIPIGTGHRLVDTAIAEHLGTASWLAAEAAPPVPAPSAPEPRRPHEQATRAAVQDRAGRDRG